MNQKVKFLILGLVVGAVGGWILTSGVKLPASRNYTMMTSAGKSQNSDLIDAHFIEQMIPHHEDAITMSKLAQEKATKPEVKKLAEGIIVSQSREIDQMKAWYKQWYGKDLPSGEKVMSQHGMMSGSQMHMGMMGEDMDLDELENSEDFDRAFVTEMIPHHQMAVMMANMLKNGTNKPEMKKLADDIITAQTSEIEMMRGWLKEWE